MPSSSQMEEQSDHQFEWETGDIGDAGEEGGAVEMESESILSEMSEDEDVPTLDAAGLSAFLQKAADGLQEFIRRGSSAAMRGAKATYAVKIGQRQSRHTENWNKQKLLEAHHEGIEGGNKITRWFHKKSAPGHEPPAGHDNASTSQSAIYNSTMATEVEESSLTDDKIPLLPPSTQVPSSVASSISESGSLFDITQSLPEFALPDSQDQDKLTNSDEIDETITNLVNCDDAQSDPSQAPEKGPFEPPPTIDVARLALADIKLVLKPNRDTGAGYKDPGIDLLMQGRLDLMKLFL